MANRFGLLNFKRMVVARGLQMGINGIGLYAMDGDQYIATVPDTLDLVDCAELSINNITAAINNPDLDYEYTWCVQLAPLRINNHACQWFASNSLTIENPALLRTMTGSDVNNHIEQNMVKSCLSRMGKGDLIYFSADKALMKSTTRYVDRRVARQ